ncbi:hypothetical protein [Sinomonas notoginsengisoli]
MNTRSERNQSGENNAEFLGDPHVAQDLPADQDRKIDHEDEPNEKHKYGEYSPPRLGAGYQEPHSDTARHRDADDPNLEEQADYAATALGSAIRPHHRGLENPRKAAEGGKYARDAQ